MKKKNKFYPNFNVFFGNDNVKKNLYFFGDKKELLNFNFINDMINPQFKRFIFTQNKTLVAEYEDKTLLLGRVIINA